MQREWLLFLSYDCPFDCVKNMSRLSGIGSQGFCDGITESLVLKSVSMEEEKFLTKLCDVIYGRARAPSGW